MAERKKVLLTANLKIALIKARTKTCLSRPNLYSLRMTWLLY
jgi:hypothetical protein